MRAIVPALFAIVIGTFMAILDTTVVNVALPTLGRIFNTDLNVLRWVITGYMLANAAVIPSPVGSATGSVQNVSTSPQ